MPRRFDHSCSSRFELTPPPPSPCGNDELLISTVRGELRRFWRCNRAWRSCHMVSSVPMRSAVSNPRGRISSWPKLSNPSPVEDPPVTAAAFELLGTPDAQSGVGSESSTRSKSLHATGFSCSREGWISHSCSAEASSRCNADWAAPASKTAAAACTRSISLHKTCEEQ
eukprot:6185780-Pleurochrysis_carterae.AAC.4